MRIRDHNAVPLGQHSAGLVGRDYQRHGCWCERRWPDYLASAGAGYTSVPSCAVTDSSGTGSGATCSALMSLQSASVSTAGVECLNGTDNFVVGIDGTGTVAQITATVSSGAVNGTPTIVVRGLLSGLGTLSAAPGYGANCTTAPTFNLSYGVAALQVTALGAFYATTHTTAALSGGAPTTAAVLGTPLISAPVPPLKTTITAYTSSTSVTLNDAAGTAISGTDQILWATNDYTAFQNALNSGVGTLVPAEIYWIGGTLDPGAGSTTISGQGMNKTIIAFDNGTSTTRDSGSWTPLFENISGSATALKGSIQIEDPQLRGLLDFGRVNVGGAGLELNNYTDLEFDRIKFYQIPYMAMQNEAIQRFTVSNSGFDTVMSDQARCRSCFAVRIIGNKFIHSNDDSVALHQASYVQGAGVVREGLIVEGNDFEDTLGVHILGARSAIIRGNSFRRTKVSATNLSWNSYEGVNQLRGIAIADNSMEDVISRVPLGAAGCVICLSVEPPSSPAGVTSFLPGSVAYPSLYFGLPWNYDLNNVTNAAAFGPASRGANIHDNMMMRTLPAVSNYSQWGYGRMFSTAGFIDPPVPDTGLKPTAGISASANLNGFSIHNNNVHNVRRGIVLNDNVVAPSQTSVSVSFNNIDDAWEYGVASFGSGSLGTFELIGNRIDVDPFMISPG